MFGDLLKDEVREIEWKWLRVTAEGERVKILNINNSFYPKNVVFDIYVYIMRQLSLILSSNKIFGAFGTI